MSSSTINNNQIEEPSKILLCKNSKTENSNLNEKNCLTQEELEILERKAKKDRLSDQRRRARMGS